MVYTIGCEPFEGIEQSSVEECLEYFKDKTELQIDTETTGGDPHTDTIITIQIGDFDRQYVIDVRNTNILQFKKLLESKLCIIQNSKFDYKMLKMANIVMEQTWDTMLAEIVLYCGYEDWGYGLDKLVYRYCGVDMSKEQRATFNGLGNAPLNKDQILYAALDVKHLQDIKEKQLARATTLDLHYCIDLENKAMSSFGDMEINGMILNKDKWLVIADKTEKEAIELELSLDTIVRGDNKLASVYKPTMVQGNMFGYEERDIKINYGSPSQIKKLLDVLGFHVDSTNERELTKLKKKHKFIEELLSLRTKNKVVSTYGRSFLNYIHPSTGRVHTSFWQIKDTGRVASGSKQDNAPNLQNIPAKNEFRNAFEARKGFKWVSIDYSGQELRIMADKSGETGFIDVLNSGEDLHCYAGSKMFGRTITKADKEDRNKAKTINFGKPYGMGVDKLADELGINTEEAEELFRMYAKEFPVLNRWLQKQGEFAKKNGYSSTFAPCKRRRWYPDITEAKLLRKRVKTGDKETWKRILTIEGQTERNGGNSPIQGTGADICKEALIGVRRLIQKYNRFYGQEVAFLICTVHDAIDCEVREDLAEAFSKSMAKIMIDAGNKYVDKVKMEVDITITDYWTK